MVQIKSEWLCKESEPWGSLLELDGDNWQAFEDFTVAIKNGCKFGGEKSFEEHLADCLDMIAGGVDDITLEQVDRLRWCVATKLEYETSP